MPQRRATSSGSDSLNSQPSPVQEIKLWHDLSVNNSSKNCHNWIGPDPVKQGPLPGGPPVKNEKRIVRSSVQCKKNRKYTQKKDHTLVGGQHGSLNDWLGFRWAHCGAVTAELVHVPTQDRIVASSLGTHPAVVVHVRRRMVLQVIECAKKTGTLSEILVRFIIKRQVMNTCACMPLWWPPRSPGGTQGSLGPPPPPRLGTVWNGLCSPYVGCPPPGVEAP